MYPPVEYDILLVKAIVVALFIYTMVVAFGFTKSIREHRKDTKYTASIKGALDALSEIKDNLRRDEKMTEVKNTMSLTDLVNRKASIHNYAEVVELLAKLARNRFEEYKFYLAKGTEETEHSFLSIVSNWNDDPELHKLIFAKGVEYGISMGKLQKIFVDYARDGHVIELGNDIMVITDDGTNLAPTGVSPITSGLEGGEIAFNLTFIKKEHYKAWCENTFPDDQEDKKQGKTEDAKIQLVVNNA